MQISAEFWNGFYSGVIATVIGFVLTMLWDVWKTWRSDKARERSVLRAMRHECEENIKLTEENIKYFSEELVALDEKKHLISTAIPLKTGLWDLLRPSIPTKLLSDVEAISLLRDVSAKAAHVNEGLRSRQTYKDTSGAMSNFIDRLKILDGFLRQETEQLREMLTKATAILARLEIEI